MTEIESLIAGWPFSGPVEVCERDWWEDEEDPLEAIAKLDSAMSVLVENLKWSGGPERVRLREELALCLAQRQEAKSEQG